MMVLNSLFELILVELQLLANSINQSVQSMSEVSGENSCRAT